VLAWQISQFGHLQAVEPAQMAPLGPRQVRLQVLAVSLNYRDLLMLRGHYNPRQPLPLVPGSDACARVLEVGSEVRRFQVGDRVCPIFSQNWMAGSPTRERIGSTLGGPLAGTLQPQMLLSEDGCVEAPAHLTAEEAATLPCAALTAWNALAGLPMGSRVVIQGTGGVSIFALQFARNLRMQVALTSSSQEKLERAESIGAKLLVNYREQPDWSKPIRSWAPAGVDCVVEVGGAGTFEQSLRCLRPGGQISLIGILAGASEKINLLPILMQQIKVQGILVGHRDSFEEMNRAILAAGIHPWIDRVFAWDEAPQAFDYLASAKHFGKIVISAAGSGGSSI
jgi:NADPH:quinone reductase-like Zn-dependent oxidoreductase